MLRMSERHSPLHKLAVGGFIYTSNRIDYMKKNGGCRSFCVDVTSDYSSLLWVESALSVVADWADSSSTFPSSGTRISLIKNSLPDNKSLSKELHLGQYPSLAMTLNTSPQLRHFAIPGTTSSFNFVFLKYGFLSIAAGQHSSRYTGITPHNSPTCKTMVSTAGRFCSTATCSTTFTTSKTIPSSCINQSLSLEIGLVMILPTRLIACFAISSGNFSYTFATTVLSFLTSLIASNLHLVVH